MEKLKFVDLFCGIGGFRIAMDEACKENDIIPQCVFSSDIDPYCQESYEANFGHRPAGDITQISEMDIPDHDILFAGFPCQPFSIIGQMQGFSDIRGTLFFDIARIVKHHQPRLLFLENVRNFERHDGGNTLKVVLKTLNELGYNVKYQVLNASDYNLPQNRERIYFVCFRKDLQIKNFEFPKPSIKKVALIDFLEAHPNDAKIIDRPDIKITKSFSPVKNIFGELDLPNRPIQIGIVNKGGQGERIYDPYGHAITLSAHGGGIGSKTGLYKIGDVIRKLTPRECARIQGFPDAFKIVSSPSQAYKQFGNSVAVNVLKAILKKISEVETSHQNNFKESIAI